MIPYRFSLAELFDAVVCLRPLADLPPEVATEVASFELVRVTTRRIDETEITEELIRVNLRDRRTAATLRRGTGFVSTKALHCKPLTRRCAKKHVGS